MSTFLAPSQSAADLIEQLNRERRQADYYFAKANDPSTRERDRSVYIDDASKCLDRAREIEAKLRTMGVAA